MESKPIGSRDASAFSSDMKSNLYSPQPSPRQPGSNKLFSMTIGLSGMYKKCNPQLRMIEVLPQRLLTNPSDPISNGGLDNEDSNLICRVHDKLIHIDKTYVILDLLGTGTFGQVFRCQRDDTKELVAVKVIKNKPAYYNQSLLEIKIARMLNGTFDANDERHLVRLHETFEFKGHMCLVFELLGMSLLDVLTQNQFRGLPLSAVQRFTKQILSALVVLEEAGVIHCDLKPENILLVPSQRGTTSNRRSPGKDGRDSTDSPSIPQLPSPNCKADAPPPPPAANPSPSAGTSRSGLLSDIKVIDFGSACFEGKTIYSYIQSRFYRSPEVLLGFPYNGSIDVWSLACVVAEMYLGLPLFPGVSQHNQLSRIVEMFGLPPDFLIEGKNGAKYFTAVAAQPPVRSVLSTTLTAGSTETSATLSTGSASKFRLKTAEEYAAENHTEVPQLRKYLRYTYLDEVIMKCPLPNKSKLTQEQRNQEVLRRRCFLDFLQGIFKLNPFERWTAKQAMEHPFITQQPFTGPFQPAVDLKTNERKLAAMIQHSQPASNAANHNTAVRSQTHFESNFQNSGGSGQFVPLGQRRLTEPIENTRNQEYAPLPPSILQHQQQRLQPTSMISPQKKEQPPQSTDSPELRPMLKRGNPVHLREGGGMPPPGQQFPLQAEPAPSQSGAHAVAMRAVTGGVTPQMDSPVFHSSSLGREALMQFNQQPGAGVAALHRHQFSADHASDADRTSVANSVESTGIPQQFIHPFSGGSDATPAAMLPPPPRPKHASNAVPPGMAQMQHRHSFHTSSQQLHQQLAYGSQGPPELVLRNASDSFIAKQPVSAPHVASSLSMGLANSVSTSVGLFGPGGSMQDGPVVMTDFGQALLRPEMDERRRFQSQQPQWVGSAQGHLAPGSKTGYRGTNYQFLGQAPAGPAGGHMARSLDYNAAAMYAAVHADEGRRLAVQNPGDLQRPYDGAAVVGSYVSSNMPQHALPANAMSIHDPNRVRDEVSLSYSYKDENRITMMSIINQKQSERDRHLYQQHHHGSYMPASHLLAQQQHSQVESSSPAVAPSSGSAEVNMKTISSHTSAESSDSARLHGLQNPHTSDSITLSAGTPGKAGGNRKAKKSVDGVTDALAEWDPFFETDD